MISCSSSLASSTPATSLNVTFFCWEVSSLARLLPKLRARLPPACSWRIMKIQKNTISTNGAMRQNIDQNPSEAWSLTVTVTPWAVSRSKTLG